MIKRILLFTIFTFLFLPLISHAQFKKYGVKGGVQVGPTFLFSEFGDRGLSFNARGFLAFELGRYLDIEVGGGFVRFQGSDGSCK